MEFPEEIFRISGASSFEKLALDLSLPGCRVPGLQ